MRDNRKLRLCRTAAMGVVLILRAVIALPLLAQSNSIQYFYDDLGRLIRAVDQNGNVASYSYDAVGNVLAITRSTLPANGLAILNFTPQSGAPGQSVTIQGQGFSTTLSSNTVQFNGVAATVTAATANSLTVTVPSTATTGLISVTVSGQSASSSTAFTVTAGALQSIAISPANSSIHAGVQQQQFTATGTFANGSQQNLTTSVQWGSSNPAVATISNAAGSQGLATAGLVGVTTIMATSGAVTGSTTLQTLFLTSLAVDPNPASIITGNSEQFLAMGTYTDGTTLNLNAISTWTSSNSFVATVSNAPGSVGIVTAVGSEFQFNGGIATICVSVTISASSSCSNLSVLPVPTSLAIAPTNATIAMGAQQFTATGTNGQNITSAVTWSSSNPSVATISNLPGTQGLATGVGVGTTTITATAGTMSTSTSLTITAAVPTVTVSPGRDVIQQGNSFQFKATLLNTNGTTQDVTQTASWESSVLSVATVSSQGVLTAVGAGSTALTATSGSASGSASVIVTNSAQATVPRYVYTNNYVDNGNVGTVSVYSANPATGQLRSLGLLLQAGDSLGFALDPASQYLYVANTSSTSVPNTLATYTIGANGSLTPLTSSPFATGNYPNAVATDPFGRFVYVVNGNDDTVTGFAVGPTGGLTPISGSPFGVGRGPLAAVVDPSGQFVYVMNNIDSTVSAFMLDPNSGALSPITGSPFATGSNPEAMTVDPSGKYVLVASVGQSTSSSDARPPSGFPSLGPVLLAALENPLAYGVSDAKKGAHIADGRFDSFNPSISLPNLTNSSYSLRPVSDSASRLSEGPSGPFAAMVTSAAQHKTDIKPECSGCGSSPASISVFAIAPASGALTPVSGSPFQISKTPDSIAVDPTDRFVYVTYDSNLIDGFALATNGTLTELADAPYTASEEFVSFVAVDPSGQFVYASGGTDALGSDVLTFSLNGGTGSLTPLGNIPGAPGLHELAIIKISTGGTYTPQFAYVSIGVGTNGANSISGYSINPSTGALSPFPGSPFAEGLSPVATATDPWSPFLYVANDCSDTACAATTGSVSAYTIDPTTGTLTATMGSPFLAGSSPLGII